MLFFKNIWYFRAFKFSLFTTNNIIDFFYFNLFRIYWKYFSISHSLFIIISIYHSSIFIHFIFVRKNTLVYSRQLLPFNIKSRNPIYKYPHIIEIYACILKVFVLIFLFVYKTFISFGICSTPKLSKYFASLDASTSLDASPFT